MEDPEQEKETAGGPGGRLIEAFGGSEARCWWRRTGAASRGLQVAGETAAVSVARQAERPAAGGWKLPWDRNCYVFDTFKAGKILSFCKFTASSPLVMHNNRKTHAVILAAGIGSRLGPAATARPKCLLEVGGRSLLRHHFEALRRAGLRRVTVVAGHLAEQVMKETKCSGVVKFNHTYADTNSLYSLWLVRNWVTGPLMVINGDVLAHPQIYQNLLAAEGCALAFDSRSDCEDEEMKVRFQGGRLTEISKTMNPDVAHGENLGILKFDAQGARVLLEEADRIVSEGRLKEWAPAALDRMAERVPVRGVDTVGLPWTEIDFPEDLEMARKEVWPAICSSPVPASKEKQSLNLSGIAARFFTPKLAS